jgi:hypothetical protein
MEGVATMLQSKSSQIATIFKHKYFFLFLPIDAAHQESIYFRFHLTFSKRGILVFLSIDAHRTYSGFGLSSKGEVFYSVCMALVDSILRSRFS